MKKMDFHFCLATMLGVLIQLFITVIVLDGVYVASQNCDFSTWCSNGDVLVRYPFRLTNPSIHRNGTIIQGNICGYPGFSISCDYRRLPVINISNHQYYVQDINYRGQSVRVVEVDIDESGCPHPRHNLSVVSTPFYIYKTSFMLLYYNCSNYPQEATKQHIPCLDHVDGNVTRHSFLFKYANEVKMNKILEKEAFKWYENCEDVVRIPYYQNSESSNNTETMKFGFQLEWVTSDDSRLCEESGGFSLFNDTTSTNHCACSESSDWTLYESICPPKGLSIQQKIIIGVCGGVAASLLLSVILYYRRKLSLTCCLDFLPWRKKVINSSNVEVFLRSCGSLALPRYKYSDIKKMTDSFKEKLGQGGYGSVFKGKLRNGRLVAVKVLNDSKSNGEEFINEVATISRTNHVNVVNLLGFCSEGTKRALVYEFMPNGSLEKFIYNAKASNTPSLLLGWEKFYQITLSIAKGLEYLHRGCNTRILHFDIKPHNILLDEHFCPKIADFGLAKLCTTRESVVSMPVARGTIGYIAPELCCRNFGGVSHKSDVYSYGMMVLEMIGGRKNIDISVDNTSEIYFPQWISNHLNLDVDVDDCGEILEDKTARKMITVALWCIQTQPASRPSITRVVEMLEGNPEGLEMPPNPFQDPASSSSP